jgi:hypothetical protein
VDFKFSGKAYGPGAEISWTSTDPKVGNGGLTIASATPDFDKIDSNTKRPASSGIWTTAGAVWTSTSRWTWSARAAAGS